MEQFQLREIRIGQETLHARPVGWSSEDPYEEGTLVTRYETTCPNCSQMLLFDVEQIVDDSVECTICGVVAEKPEGEAAKEKVNEPSTVVVHDGPDISSKDIKHPRPVRTEPSPQKEQDDECPFQDPLVAGELKPA